MASMFGSQTTSLPRGVAVVLALGAAFWGGFLLLAFGPDVLLPITPFGYGYFVLAGYVMRAVTCPTLRVRRAIWIASIVVQGMWLCIGLACIKECASCCLILQLWWVFATITSVFAIIEEQPDISEVESNAATYLAGV